MIRLRPSGVDEILIKRVQDWYEPGPGVFITSTSTLFSPAMLFTGTTTGVWYDPSDLTTLYRDAAGTLPVTAVEQPVGLMLDKSKGLVLGPELVTNGDFSNGAMGWSIGAASWSISGGAALNNGTNSIYASIYQSNVVTAGKFYVIEWDQITTSGAVNLYLNALQLVGASISGTGRKSFKVTASVSGSVFFEAYPGAVISIDNISVREISGNHAFNPSGNSANFPVLSARYNLLTKTEQFDDAVWSKNQSTISTNSVTAPNGTLTADRLTATGTAAYVFHTAYSLTNTPYIFSVSVLKGTSFTIAIDNTTSTGRGVTFDGATGAFVTLNTLGAGYAVAAYSCVSHPLDANYWLASITVTPNSGTNNVSIWINTAKSSSYAGSVLSTAGDTLTVWGADLRVANDALNQPAYQRVNTSSDYDTVGFKPYLRFNGTNQWLQTNSIDFTYGDKMFVSAGVRKLSDAAQGVIAELSTSAGANVGAILLDGPNTVATNYRFASRGSILSSAIATNYAAPITNVLSGIGNISGDQSILRVNGSQAASNTADQGTGNYGNYPLYIGARAGSSLWANIRFYGAVVAGKQVSAAEITNTETFINQKTGAY